MVGATARLTRLVTHDTITEFIRRWAARTDARRKLSRAMREPGFGTAVPRTSDERTNANPVIEGPGRLYGFITCPWCVSMWLGLATVAAVAVTRDHPHAQQWLLYAYAALTASAVTGELTARRTP